MIAHNQALIDDLTTLNRIAETLNRAVDMRSALDSALASLLDLMGLETGWIFLKDPGSQNQWQGKGYVLAAHHNLPPALALNSAKAWKGGCECQGLCNHEQLVEAYNEVWCTRLADTKREDRRGLTVHASAPLRSGSQVLGILNVAGPTWESFTPETLALLTNVGSQMGIALERARLFDLLQERRIDEQAALLDLSNQLLSRSDLNDLMDYLVQEGRQLLGMDACALILPAGDLPQLAFVAATGWRSDPVIAGRTLADDRSNGPSQVMHSQQPLVAEDIARVGNDADATPRWLQGEGFRGHAVVPLIVDGHSVGVMVINSRRPRLLEEDELRFLQLMANQAAFAVERARLHKAELQRQHLEHELTLGRQIQLSMLPKAQPQIPGWEFVAVYQAARLVGGDFYDYFQLPGEPEQLGLVIADVADKGVPSALFMVLSRTVIRSAALSGRSPAATLIRANELILKDSQADLFLSAVYASLEVQSGRLVYANGGHNRPLWLQAATGRVKELAATGILLGLFEDISLEEQSIQVERGDLLLFFTDGIPEAFGSDRQMFGMERLRQVLTACVGLSAHQVSRALVQAYNDYTGTAEQSDDVTFFVLRRQPDKEQLE